MFLQSLWDGRDIPMIHTEPITDASGIKYAGISVNVVILDGGGTIIYINGADPKK